MTSIKDTLKKGLTFLLLLGFTPLAFAAAMDVRPGVTDISQEIQALHHISLSIVVVIGILVFGVMFYSIYAHRRSKNPTPATFHESTKVEILWTAIPFVILIAMAVPATKTLIDIYDADEADVDILVTGYQWRWQYQYVGEGVSFFSTLTTPRDEITNVSAKSPDYLLEVDNPLVIPVGKKVRFLVTASDVIHSWWVPDFAVKKDAIPGFINEAWTRVEEPGIYRGQCTELCGKDHGFMPVVVQVLPQDEYDTWLAEQKEAAAKEAELRDKTWTLDELVERGEKVYTTACASCHQPNGEGLPPMFPALKGSQIATEDMAAHLDIVLNGKPGTAMAAFGKQLSEVDIAAVITYERNAWGNDTGEMLSPIDVLKAKEGQ